MKKMFLLIVVLMFCIVPFFPIPDAGAEVSDANDFKFQGSFYLLYNVDLEVTDTDTGYEFDGELDKDYTIEGNGVLIYKDTVGSSFGGKKVENVFTDRWVGSEVYLSGVEALQIHENINYGIHYRHGWFLDRVDNNKASEYNSVGLAMHISF